MKKNRNDEIHKKNVDSTAKQLEFIPEMMEGINLMRGKARNGYPPRVSDGECPRRFEDV